ncbi:MAG: hypothetical protein ACOYT8_04930 [Candidatus Dependentiae bacterium]
MSLKKQTTQRLLSFSDQQRLATFFQILATIDKRISSSKTKQSKAPNQGRTVGSLIERASLLAIIIAVILYLLLTR